MRDHLIGVYVHIPFCRQKCHYCDFVSYAGVGSSVFQHYVTALCREITDKGGIFTELGYKVDTVYIGGGTPTILPSRLLLQVLESLQKHFRLLPGTECSIEANPGTVTANTLAALRAGGVNRISYGIQVFDENILKSLGRIHSVTDGIQAVNMAVAAGFTCVNIDLMVGLPGQSLAGFRQGLIQAASLPVQHLSVYGLTVEAGTSLAQQLQQGKLSLPDETVDEAMYELTQELLPEYGFERYEISNYARSGYQCRHNLKYWQYLPYIGLGVAAHSFTSGKRTANTSDVGQYIEFVLNGKSPAVFEETPDQATAMAEYTFLALRTVAGLNYQTFFARFAVDFCAYYQDVLTNLLQNRLIDADAAGVRLTEKGMKYGNQVFAAFLPGTG